MEGAGSELVLASDLDATIPAQPATKEPIAATTSARVLLEARPLTWIPRNSVRKNSRIGRAPTLEESDQNSPETQTKPFRTDNSFT